MQAFLLLLLGIVLWSVYWPGLSGPYVFDDFQNITLNPAVAIQSLSASELLSAAFSNAEGGLGRPIAMLTFALNYYLAGNSFDPLAFKVTNLAIHTGNVLLVYFLTRLLFLSARSPSVDPSRRTRQRSAVLLAILAAALWGLHPLQLTSVLYTVQRMTSLSAFFVLAGLLVFVYGRCVLRMRPVTGITMMTGGIVTGTALGLLCKENAVLLPLLAATVELGVFSRDELIRDSRRKLALFYLCVVGIPAVAGIVYLALNPEFVLQTYATRNFGLTERLLTETRVLFFYLSLIVFPFISRFGLYHDDFPLSTGMLSPPSTLLATMAWVLVVVALVKGLRRRAVWAFALAWFLAGHALESGVLGLEIVHEHRNYVPSIGICMAASYYFWVIFDKFKIPPRTVAICSVTVLLAVAFVTHTRSWFWSSRAQLFESLVERHPGSYRAIAGLATAMSEQRRDVRPVFNALRDAALANASTLHPLIEMKRILHALIPAGEALEFGNSKASVDEGESATWASDLVLDQAYLLELDRALTREIARRLEEGNVHIETIYSLWRAQACLSSGAEHCASLKDELLEWHMVVLAKLPPGNHRRGKLELSVAKIYAADGDTDRALHYVDRAIATMSGNPRYRAQKAMLLLKLGSIEQAEIITDAIEREMDWRRIYAGDVEVLRREIENTRLRREQGSARASSDEMS